jgi:hypothetical protein
MWSILDRWRKSLETIDILSALAVFLSLTALVVLTISQHQKNQGTMTVMYIGDAVASLGMIIIVAVIFRNYLPGARRQYHLT